MGTSIFQLEVPAQDSLGFRGSARTWSRSRLARTWGPHRSSHSRTGLLDAKRLCAEAPRPTLEVLAVALQPLYTLIPKRFRAVARTTRRAFGKMRAGRSSSRHAAGRPAQDLRRPSSETLCEASTTVRADSFVRGPSAHFSRARLSSELQGKKACGPRLRQCAMVLHYRAQRPKSTDS